MKKYLILMLVAAAFFAACNDGGSEPPVIKKDDDKKEEPAPSKHELLVKAWIIDYATHDGVYDSGSTGKEVDFFENGTYKWDNSYNGFFAWSEDSSTLYLDNATQYEQNWKIAELTDSTFEVDFNSPFTGKPANWQMVKK